VSDLKRLAANITLKAHCYYTPS